MNGAELIIKILEQQAVEYIFGYPGGPAYPILDALNTLGANIKFILARHEQGAAHMADGYARASGKPGVILVTSGPSAGNLLTGLMTAHMDSVPLVALTAQQSTPVLGYDAFQEADIFHITMPVTKHNYQVRRTADLPRILHEAFHLATSGRPGPVLVDLPKDISIGELSDELQTPPILPAYRHEHEIDSAAIKKIATAWQTAKRPVILAGHGVIIAGAAAELQALAERMDTPVTTTLLGKGAFPETHRLSLGMLGMHGTAYANKAVVECDFLLNIGSRFDDRITGKVTDFCQDGFIAHIDIDAAELGKLVQPRVAIQGDARDALRALQAATSPQQHKTWNAHLDTYRRTYPLSYDNSQGLTAQYVIDTLYQQTAGQAVVVTDVGQHQMWAAQFYKTDSPDMWLSSGGAGTMGFGLPAAIGAQFARPGQQVVAIVGDGGFQMTLFELATACNHKLPIKIFIMNNHYLGMVRQWQELLYGNRPLSADLEGNPDFMQIAAAYGARGIAVTAPAEASTKIAEALAVTDRPVIVNAEVVKAENVMPMIPPGASLADMILSSPSRPATKKKPKQ